MNGETVRVPMPGRGPAWIAEDDVALSRMDTRVGQRFTLDIAEDALANIGRAGLVAAVEELGRRVAHQHAPDIQRVVHSFILDRQWAEPIIREAIRDAVRSVIADMFHPRDKE